MVKPVNIEVFKEAIYLKRRKITVGNKIIRSPFFCPMPCNNVDLKILCDMLNPNNLEKIRENPEEEIDFMGGVMYRIFEHDPTTRAQSTLIKQLDLTNKSLSSTFEYINQTKIKLVDPATDLLRNGAKGFLDQFLLQEKVPEYLKEHISNIKNWKDRYNLDIPHNKFWNSLFDTKEKTVKSAHFLNWHYELQMKRKADIFLPPTPLINYNSSNVLIDKAIHMNLDSQDIFGENTATYFNIDMNLFKDKAAISSILNHIDSNPTKFTMFKIVNCDNILNKGFGEYSRKNFEDFLRVIKHYKDNEQTNSIFGVLNGGGFGFCLLGAGFDFFVDTINNYDQHFIRPGKKDTHRKLLNPNTLALEPIDGVDSMLKENGTLPAYNHIVNKYRKVSSIRTVNSKEWSIDCRKSGLLTWNQFVRELVKAINNKEDSLFFDLIQRSDYAILGNIIRKINS